MCVADLKSMARSCERYVEMRRREVDPSEVESAVVHRECDCVANLTRSGFTQTTGNRRDTSHREVSPGRRVGTDSLSENRNLPFGDNEKNPRALSTGVLLLNLGLPEPRAGVEPTTC